MSDRPRIARIYSSLRTAHLERFQELDASTVIYRTARYDFDPRAGDPASPPRQLGRGGTIWHLLTRTYDVVEVNEPGMARLWPDLILQVAAIRARSWATRRHTSIVTYCIGIVDPSDDAIGHRILRPRVVAVLSKPFLRMLIGSMDRIAFGTTGSYAMYRRHVTDRALRPKARFFEAVPAPCRCLHRAASGRQGTSVAFVGAFSERKGIQQLMDVWDIVGRGRPDLTLTLVGQGEHEAAVRAWASGRSGVHVEVDPPRHEIHQILRDTDCLVLLSQRVGGWREQVGLPIVEALAHGCEVVTTDETGLADWLREQGHLVVPAASPVAAVAAMFSAHLRDRRSSDAVLRDLPDEDQRLAADRWMVGA
ncbi:glycosyltransferase [Allobranchiibius sp. CTAmp26]|uniref:glycosyltransferase n=1 Tax=Allobranchiibius sp. CTAmp26 TaxID=2815214 RepID=UPI001AA0E813|nr:glycosyltransferase [Allobranchiibius sp. CTAmp26]MBO1756829.1 glycosyltransferase family 4 protein [Allobranchiibius sp. CTAmp26]